MKSINEYSLEKTGLTLEAQGFADKMKKHFTYESCSLTESGIKFNDVTLLEDIKFTGLGKGLNKGTRLSSLEIRKNGWLDVSENENSSYTVMSHNLKESFIMNDSIPVNASHTTKDFPVVTAIQLESLAAIQKVIDNIKRLSAEDIVHLKNIMGPSLEEKIFEMIINYYMNDNPPHNGQQNGV